MEKPASIFSSLIPDNYKNIRDYLIILISLILTGVFVDIFNVESAIRLPTLFPFIIAAFAINGVLPPKLKLPFLVLFNFVTILYLFGGIPGIIIIALGLAAIGACHLPLNLPLRVIIILSLFFFPAMELAGFIESKIQIGTILGALFMFRLIVYLYEIRFEKGPVDFWKRLNYFFLLPNLVLHLFPVIDFKTFIKSYYAKPAFEIYRKGLRWVLRGITHLIAYRIIYYYLVPAPSDVDGLLSLSLYLVSSYALILRLSGFFHLGAGVVCLFGFDLPPTFNNYFLASGFSDLWRRINIYWKDFIMKVFYFPIYFKFKKRNNTALVVTILVIFIINWFLHSYQWFWIRGTFPLRQTDIIFWGIFGIAIAGNSVYQKNKNPKPRLKSNIYKKSFVQALQVLGMLAFMCLLYTLWISESPQEWLTLIKQGQAKSKTELTTFIAILFGLLALGTLGFATNHYVEKRGYKVPEFSNLQIVAFTLFIGLLCLLGQPNIQSNIKQNYDLDVSPLLETKLNKADQERMYRGYYETITEGGNIGSNVEQLNQLRPDNWDKLHTTGIVIDKQSMILKALKSDTSVIFKEALFVTNEYGLRDHSYTLEKPETTLRIALLGTSIEMGSGVETGQTYENVLESRLNATHIWSNYNQVEILNFAISGIHLPQQVAIAKERVGKFSPDIIMYTAHPNEASRSLRRFASLYMDNLLSAYPELITIGEKAGIKPGLSHEEAQRLLRPYQEELLLWGLTEIIQTCDSLNAVPLWVYVPSFGENPQQDENIKLAELADSLGFLTYDISNTYKGKSKEDVIVRPWDRHPSVNGHNLLAKELFQNLRKDSQIIQDRLDQLSGN